MPSVMAMECMAARFRTLSNSASPLRLRKALNQLLTMQKASSESLIQLKLKSNSTSLSARFKICSSVIARSTCASLEVPAFLFLSSAQRCFVPMSEIQELCLSGAAKMEAKRWRFLLTEIIRRTSRMKRRAF